MFPVQGLVIYTDKQMNWRLVILGVIQSFLLACGQVSLKLAMLRVPKFTWTWNCIKAYLQDYWFLFTGIFFTAATVLWMYILKNFPFGESYPLTSLAYVFGMIAALVVFRETASLEKWIGVILILVGAFLLTKK